MSRIRGAEGQRHAEDERHPGDHDQPVGQPPRHRRLEQAGGAHAADLGRDHDADGDLEQVAIVVAIIQVLFAEAYGLNYFTGTAIAIGVGFALRLIAYWRGWRLPTGLDWGPSKILQRVAKPRPSDNPPESE